VLIENKYKWKGYYKGEIIDFFMNDSKFKDEIQAGTVKFQAGSILKCKLITRRKIDEAGILKTTSMAVDSVYEVITTNGTYITNTKKIEDKKKKDDYGQIGFEFNR